MSEEEHWKALEAEDRKRIQPQERKQAQVRKQVVYEQREEFGVDEALKRYHWTEHEQQSEQTTKQCVERAPVKAKGMANDDAMTVSFQLDADGVLLID